MTPLIRKKQQPVVELPKKEPYYEKMFAGTTILCQECGYAIPFSKNDVELECLVCGTQAVLLG